jgi:hypothetical protein
MTSELLHGLNNDFELQGMPNLNSPALPRREGEEPEDPDAPRYGAKSIGRLLTPAEKAHLVLLLFCRWLSSQLF